ncbi:hypothetical protein [Lichenicoccus sp.]|uniref:hypothetical protein n=1 Tax=Lichenicoccus sp. TaxID=2781899 RepID=UPI003D10C5E6
MAVPQPALYQRVGRAGDKLKMRKLGRPCRIKANQLIGDKVAKPGFLTRSVHATTAAAWPNPVVGGLAEFERRPIIGRIHVRRKVANAPTFKIGCKRSLTPAQLDHDDQSRRTGWQSIGGRVVTRLPTPMTYLFKNKSAKRLWRTITARCRIGCFIARSPNWLVIQTQAICS